MNQAGEYYRNGEFDKAIEIYEELRNEGYEGTSLYFNLANSYYRIGRLGYAILNFERALDISPTDEDVKHNLAFANLSTVDRIQPLPTFFLFDYLLLHFIITACSLFLCQNHFPAEDNSVF
jgi:pentatricopeptide repeat protein